METGLVSNDFLTLLRQGGVALYPLLLCSVTTVTIVLERSWFLLRSARGARRLHRLVTSTLDEEGAPAALALCRADASPPATAYRAILGHSATNGDQRLREVSRLLAGAGREARRFVWLLGTIGSLAPFIGLFGTVIGIIRAFENMAATGSGGFAVVAAGISEALIATAAGLLVGVLSIFAYNAFLVRIGALSAEWRDRADELLARTAPTPQREEARPRVI